LYLPLPSLAAAHHFKSLQPTKLRHVTDQPNARLFDARLHINTDGERPATNGYNERGGNKGDIYDFSYE
jgi:hypothetical protein